MNKTSFTEEDHVAIEQIDQEITEILMTADKACMKCGNLPWSLQLHEAYMVHHYWSLKKSERKTGRPYPNAYAKIKATIPPERLNHPETLSISINLRQAQTTLS